MTSSLRQRTKKNDAAHVLHHERTSRKNVITRADRGHPIQESLRGDGDSTIKQFQTGWSALETFAGPARVLSPASGFRIPIRRAAAFSDWEDGL
ncbi:MAG TPA: hypothetical protein VFL51_12385 [Pseudolabrys sp.]|nr:hypothetical protein [Pseudolabrys sp.]